MEDLVGVLALSAARDFVKRAYMGAPPGSSGFAPGVGYGSVSRYGGMGYGFGGPMMQPGYSQLHQLAMVRNPGNAYVERNEDAALAREHDVDKERAELQRLYAAARNKARFASIPSLASTFFNPSALGQATSGQPPLQGNESHYLVDPDTLQWVKPEFNQGGFFGSSEKGWFDSTNPNQDWKDYLASRDAYMSALHRFRGTPKTITDPTTGEPVSVQYQGGREQRLQTQADRQRLRAEQMQGLVSGYQGNMLGLSGQVAGAEAGYQANRLGAGAGPESASIASSPAPARPAAAPTAPPPAPFGAPPAPGAFGAPGGPGGRPASAFPAGGDDLVDRLARAAVTKSAGARARAAARTAAEVADALPAALAGVGGLGGAVVLGDPMNFRPGAGERAVRGALVGGGAGAGAGLGYKYLGRPLGLLSIPLGGLAGAALGGAVGHPLAARLRDDDTVPADPHPRHDPYEVIPRDHHALTADDMAAMAAKQGSADPDEMPLPELDTHMRVLHPRKKPRRPRPLSAAASLARSAASRADREAKEAGDVGGGMGELAAAAAGR